MKVLCDACSMRQGQLKLPEFKRKLVLTVSFLCIQAGTLNIRAGVRKEPAARFKQGRDRCTRREYDRKWRGDRLEGQTVPTSAPSVLLEKTPGT